MGQVREVVSAVILSMRALGERMSRLSSGLGGCSTKGVSMTQLLKFRRGGIIAAVSVVDRLRLGGSGCSIAGSFGRGLPVVLGLSDSAMTEARRSGVRFVGSLMTVSGRGGLSRCV